MKDFGDPEPGARDLRLVRSVRDGNVPEELELRGGQDDQGMPGLTACHPW